MDVFNRKFLVFLGFLAACKLEFALIKFAATKLFVIQMVVVDTVMAVVAIMLVVVTIVMVVVSDLVAFISSKIIYL